MAPRTTESVTEFELQPLSFQRDHAMGRGGRLSMPPNMFPRGPVSSPAAAADPITPPGRRAGSRPATPPAPRKFHKRRIERELTPADTAAARSIFDARRPNYEPPEDSWSPWNAVLGAQPTAAVEDVSIGCCAGLKALWAAVAEKVAKAFKH